MKKKAKVFRPTAFAFPYLAVTLIFVIVPLFLVLFYAFKGSDGNFTVDNFRKVFSEKETLEQLGKTIGIATLSTAICLLIAYPVAYVLSSAPFKKMAILALLFIIPMWINFMLRMFALKSLLSMIGIQNGYGAAVIGIIYDFFPYMLLPIYTVLSNMDKSYVEASRDLGAGSVRTFFRVTLPLNNGATSKVFVGWDIDGDGIADMIPATTSVDISARAVMETVENKYTVNFFDLDRTAVLYSYIVTHGDMLELPVPTKTGYTFDGWSGYYGGTITSNISVYSSWHLQYWQFHLPMSKR